MLSEPEEPQNLHVGVIPQSERQKELEKAYDPVSRNAKFSNTNILKNNEYRQLRQDTDRKYKQAYEQLHARDDEDWDFEYGRLTSGKSRFPILPLDLEEDAEKYLEMFPQLAEELFQQLDAVMPPARNVPEIDTAKSRECLDRRFNCLAQVHQTEHISLEPRISALVDELWVTDVNLNHVKNSIHSCLSIIKKISGSNKFESSEYKILEVMITLKNVSQEFELFTSILLDSSRRLGMLKAQKQIYKMLNVMILYVRALRFDYENMNLKYETLKKNLEHARQLLKDNGIVPCDGSESTQNKCRGADNPTSEDDDESENETVRLIGAGSSALKRLCRSLVHRKMESKAIKSSTCLQLVKKKQATCLALCYDVFRRELYWPWNRELTVNGLTQGISLFVIILGMFVYLWGFFPSISIFDENGCSDRFFFRNIGSYIHNKCRES